MVKKKRKKRKYTFRKGEPIPYESGSVMHKLKKGLEPKRSKKRKKKRGLF